MKSEFVERVTSYINRLTIFQKHFKGQLQFRNIPSPIELWKCFIDYDGTEKFMFEISSDQGNWTWLN